MKSVNVHNDYDFLLVLTFEDWYISGRSLIVNWDPDATKKKII